MSFWKKKSVCLTFVENADARDLGLMTLFCPVVTLSGNILAEGNSQRNWRKFFEEIPRKFLENSQKILRKFLENS